MVKNMPLTAPIPRVCEELGWSVVTTQNYLPENINSDEER
jgi:hypothetical protein